MGGKLTLDTFAFPEQPAVAAARAVRLSWWQHGAIFLIACLIAFSRRPDMFFHAQFYAEDGMGWFADAYNYGWFHALFRPWTGIFQTVPRLVAGPALLVPLAAAPALMNLFQLMLQVLPVNILLSARSEAWGSFHFRVLLAVLYLVLPDCTEISYGISWAQWPMAVAAVLLIVATLPEGWGQRAAEAVFLLLTGLTGPACILILPVALFLAWKRPHRWRWVQCGILVVGVLAELDALLILDPSGRPNYGIGINPATLTRIFSGDVFFGALLGRTSIARLPGIGGLIFLAISALMCLSVLLWCFVHARLEMKLFQVFAAMMLLVSLVRPTAYPPPGMTVWELFLHTPDMRYWFIPSLAIAWAVLWCQQHGNELFKAVSTLLLGIMIFGVIINWEHNPLVDMNFSGSVARFQAAKPGTLVKIPENPAGFDWEIKLVKH